jgi:hypothetical protein
MLRNLPYNKNNAIHQRGDKNHALCPIMNLFSVVHILSACSSNVCVFQYHSVIYAIPHALSLIVIFQEKSFLYLQFPSWTLHVPSNSSFWYNRSNNMKWTTQTVKLSSNFSLFSGIYFAQSLNGCLWVNEGFCFSITSIYGKGIWSILGLYFVSLIYISSAQDRDHWRALVNTVMNLRVP